jgi:TonB family protein
MGVGDRSSALFGAFALVAIVSLGASHAYGGIAISNGGPKKKADKSKLKKALARLGPALEICWRGDRPDKVKISLTVAADGSVTKAKQKTKGAAAQCAAGVLAVHSLPATGSKYKAVVALPTEVLDIGAQIQSDLRGYHSALQACGDGTEGTVVLKFKIHPDGSVSKAKIESSTVGDKAVHKCLKKTINAATLTERPGGKVLGYSLNVNLPPASSKTASKSNTGGKMQPKKTGPRPADDISDVMNAKMGKFGACYKKRAKKKKNLSGSVVLRFTIRPAGTVRNVKVRETTLDDSVVEKCLVKVAKTLDFGAHDSSEVTKVFYPFNFSP